MDQTETGSTSLDLPHRSDWQWPTVWHRPRGVERPRGWAQGRLRSPSPEASRRCRWPDTPWTTDPVQCLVVVVHGEMSSTRSQRRQYLVQGRDARPDEPSLAQMSQSVHRPAEHQHLCHRSVAEERISVGVGRERRCKTIMRQRAHYALGTRKTGYLRA